MCNSYDLEQACSIKHYRTPPFCFQWKVYLALAIYLVQYWFILDPLLGAKYT